MLRFATSPSENLSISALRTALITLIVARQRGEEFLLRFDDDKHSHQSETREEEIKQVLEKFALHVDRVLHQGEHPARYQQMALRLLEERKAFLCTCPSETPGSTTPPSSCRGRCLSMDTEEIRRIRAEKRPFSLRIRKPDAPISFIDRIRGEIRIEPHEVDHFVILLPDGTPGRDFASACDDMMSDISLVIEEESDHSMIAAARAIHIRNALGYAQPIEYAHLPPFLDAEGRRCAHGDEAHSVRALLREGYLPDAIINTLLLPGQETPSEIFTLPDAVRWFELSKLSPDPVRFDRERLRSINREHLRRMDDRTLSRIFRFADPDIGRLAKLYLDEAATVNELEEKIRAVFAPKRCDGRWGETMRRLSQLIAEAPYFDDFSSFFTDLSRRSGLEKEKLLEPMRRLFTGSSDGPEPETLYPTIKSYLTEIARCQH